MTNNFFKMLARLDSEFLQKYSSLPVSGRQTIQRLIVYVESGKWSRSEITKLYCRNWDRSYDQIRLIFREEGFKDRSEVTIRSQVSELSRNLCEMFGTCDEIYNAFRAASGRAVGDMTKAQGERYIAGLDSKLGALEGYQDEPFLRRLAVNPHHFGISPFPERLYQVSECMDEITLLKTLSVESVQALCGKVDSDKVAFLLQALNRPLLVSERSERHRRDGCEGTYKVNRLSVNTAKVDILQALDLAVPKKMIPVGFKNSEAKEENLSVDGTTGVKESFAVGSGVSAAGGLPFKFDAMGELCGVIQEKCDSDLKITVDSDQRKKNIAYLKKMFGLLTSEGLRKHLDRFMGGDVALAAKDFERG
ncbi:MAG: hypothetical protein NC548_34475 [Lachnospiraceae bacterium]|nr:hypothetical protein [Lachnospiraceae bacterium]